MTTNELNRAVARATGETVSMIRRLGFLLDDPAAERPDTDFADLGPQIVDWDGPDAQRSETYPGRPHREPTFA